MFLIWFLVLLILSVVQSLHAACPAGMYCPTGADCGVNRTLCEASTCPTGGNINLIANWTDDCEEGVSLSFTRASYSVTENRGPSQPVLVLSRPLRCCTISVIVKIDEGTAKGNTDYGFKPSAHIPVVFSAGVTATSFDVPMIDDRILENTETFGVSIDPVSLPYGVTLVSPASATVSIIDNDDVTVSFNETTFTAYENNRLAKPVLVLSNTVSYNITVAVSTFDVNATSSCDYDSGRHSVTFPAGVTHISFNINITDDDLFEGPEVFNLAITSSLLPSNVFLGSPSRATVAIVDDEKPIIVRFNQSMYMVREHDGVVTPVLTLNKPSPCCITIRATLSDLTAIGGVDYGDVPSSKMYNFTFPAGATCASSDASIPIIDDTISENDETFSIAIMERYLPYGIELSGTAKATIFIEDNDNAIRFERSAHRVTENRGPVIAILVLDKPAKSDMVVQVIDNSVTATGNGTDYVSGPYFARFRRNSRRSTIIVNIVDDNRPELDETFRLTINATSLPFGVIRSNPYSTIVTIIDDEYTVCFDESNYRVQEGDRLEMTLVINKRLTTSINVQLRYDNSLTASSDDYRPPLASYVQINAGRTSASFFISAMDDRILERDESFIILADPPSIPDGHSNCSATVTIVDTDAITVRFEREAYPVANKNSPVQPILLLSGAASFPISVRVLEVDGTATGDQDYEIQNYSPVFYPGETRRGLLLDLIDDDTVEDTEYFFLNISSSLPERVTIGRYASTKITIIDDDVSYFRVAGRDLGLSKPLYTDIKIKVIYTSGSYSDITVSAGLTRVPLGAARNGIRAIQVCAPKNIADDTKTYDPLVKMRCA